MWRKWIEVRMEGRYGKYDNLNPFLMESQRAVKNLMYALADFKSWQNSIINSAYPQLTKQKVRADCWSRLGELEVREQD